MGPLMHLEGSSALLNASYQIFTRSCICILLYGRGFSQQKRCPQKSSLFSFELVILVFMILDRVLLLLLLGSSYSQYRHYLWTPPLPHVVTATLWICKYYSQLSQRVELFYLSLPAVIHKNFYQNINVLIFLSSTLDFTSGLSLLKTSYHSHLHKEISS